MCLVVLVAVVPIVATSQSTEFLDCLGDGVDLTTCTDVSTGDLVDLFCPGGVRLYMAYRGRVAWYPLRYVGPIMVELQARQVAGTRYPLFVEFFPLRDHPPGIGYCDGPALVLMTVRGDTVCDTWETAGPVYLDRWLSVGDAYVIRVHFVGDARVQFGSPYLGCIRVRLAVTAVNDSTWGLVKVLYRD